MSTPEPPKRKIQLRSDESPWGALARELASNPDSPASLQIVSAIRQSVQPQVQAVEQVVSAIEAQCMEDGEHQRVAVQAAIQCWERACHTEMDSATLADFHKMAQQRIDRRRRHPPSMTSILTQVPTMTDTGYQLGVHMQGIEGTWHRLWGIIVLSCGFTDNVDADEAVVTVRAQFENLLGREMLPEEWRALVVHAKHHHQTVVEPSANQRSADHSD